MTRKSSLHLVAPELSAALGFFREMDFDQNLAAYRQGAKIAEAVPAHLAHICLEERHIPATNGAPDVRLLVYSPPGRSSVQRPAILHIHGGGFVLGSPEINDTWNRMAVAAHNCIVVSVAYRLAPETLFPGALEDCLAALRWMSANACELGIDERRIAVAGESAGGGHAVALALHVRDLRGPQICFLLLDAPMLDDRTGSSGEPHPYCGEFVWTLRYNRFAWRALLGIEPGGSGVAWDAVPARCDNLAGLPPTFISVGALDLFLEEDMEFARRLARAGVPIELHVISGAFHGFRAAGVTPQLSQLLHLRDTALETAFREIPS